MMSQSNGRGRPKQAPETETTKRKVGRPRKVPPSLPSVPTRKRGRPKRPSSDEPAVAAETDSSLVSAVDGRKRARREGGSTRISTDSTAASVVTHDGTDDAISREIEKAFVLSMVPGSELSPRRRYIESWKFACKPTKVQDVDTIVQYYGARSKLPIGIKRIIEGIGDQAWICKCCFEDPTTPLDDCLKIIDPSSGSNYFKHHLEDEHPNRYDQPSKKPYPRIHAVASNDMSSKKEAPKKKRGWPRGRPRGRPSAKKGRQQNGKSHAASVGPGGNIKGAPQKSAISENGSPAAIVAAPRPSAIPTFDELTSSLMMDESERFYFQDLEDGGGGRSQQQTSPLNRNVAFSNLLQPENEEPFPVFLDDDHMMVEDSSLVDGPTNQERRSNGSAISGRGLLYYDSFVNTSSPQVQGLKEDVIDEDATNITNSEAANVKCSPRLAAAGGLPPNALCCDVKEASTKPEGCEVSSIASHDNSRLGLFVAQHEHCLKCPASHFVQWLQSEDIQTLHELSEAMCDHDFVSTDMKAHGLKGFKRHVFAKAVKSAAEKAVADAAAMENEQSSSSSSLTSSSSLINNGGSAECGSNKSSNRLAGWFSWVQSPLAGWL